MAVTGVVGSRVTSRSGCAVAVPRASADRALTANVSRRPWFRRVLYTAAVIHVLDVLAVAPGRLGDVRRRVHDEYAPLMAALEMRLAATWIAPAVELDDRPTELLLLWHLPDVPTFWRMRTTAAADTRVALFWDEVMPMLTDRERKLMCDPDDDTILR